MRKRPEVSRRGHLVRTTHWHGVRAGDAVVVDGTKERRQHWVFVAHVLNEATNEEWIEVRGGRTGEVKSRSFRTATIYPSNAKKGSRVVGLSLDVAPQLPMH